MIKIKDRRTTQLTILWLTLIVLFFAGCKREKGQEIPRSIEKKEVALSPKLKMQPTLLALGDSHSCALNSNGGVNCWGKNDSGQLGNGTKENSLMPVSVDGLNENVVAITAGSNHTCALTKTGVVKCWGWNKFGQLGDGTTTDRMKPSMVINLPRDVISIYAGGSQTLALTSTGAVLKWGSNFTYSGDYSGGLKISTTFMNKPISRKDLENGNIAIMTARGDKGCAIENTGRVKCWELFGREPSPPRGFLSSAPKNDPEYLQDIPNNIKSISFGESHQCILNSDGGVLCWGENGSGELGDGQLEYYSKKPVPVKGLESGVMAIEVSDGCYSCALLSDGRVKCWGKSPVEYGCYWGKQNKTPKDIDPVPVEIKNLEKDVIAISLGKKHYCAMLADGVVKCWGVNDSGQLGNGSKKSSVKAVEVKF